MVDVTVLEVHLDESNLTANAPFSDRGKDVAASGEAPAASVGPSKGRAVAALIGLVFLVGVAFLAKRRIGGGDDVEVEETVDVGGVEA